MLLLEPRERPLQSIEHPPEQARPEPHGELRPGRRDRLSEAEAARALVDLHHGALALEPHDLAREPRVADGHPLVDSQARDVDADRRPGDADDAAAHALNLTW